MNVLVPKYLIQLVLCKLNMKLLLESMDRRFPINNDDLIGRQKVGIQWRSKSVRRPGSNQSFILSIDEI